MPVVAYTDARVKNSLRRLEKLGLKGLLAGLYAPAHAEETQTSSLDDKLVHLLAPSDRKPNPQTLLDICSRFGVRASDAVYVGDSIVRDVYMAKQAGVCSAWAKYGTLYVKTLWPQLVRVTHWSEADVEREKIISEQARGTEPDCVLELFGDILKYFVFEHPPQAIRPKA